MGCVPASSRAVTTHLRALLRNSRFVAGLTLAALLWAVVAPTPRLEAAIAALAAGDGSEVPWLVSASDSQPARIERGAEVRGEAKAAPDAPAGLAPEAASGSPEESPQPARAASTHWLDPRTAHRRPAPTGPPRHG